MCSREQRYFTNLADYIAVFPNAEDLRERLAEHNVILIARGDGDLPGGYLWVSYACRNEGTIVTVHGRGNENLSYRSHDLSAEVDNLKTLVPIFMGTLLFLGYGAN